VPGCWGRCNWRTENCRPSRYRGIVDVVAPHATEKVEEWAQERKIHWFKRKFHDSDLDACLLVHHRGMVKITQLRDVHDVAEHSAPPCEAMNPFLQFTRGGCHDDGESPALAHRLRKELEAQFGPEYEDWLAELAVRHEIEVRNQPHFFAVTHNWE
jgi:precorrin-2 dehydrogenase / sirohydrochlorin ferrochelatase